MNRNEACGNSGTKLTIGFQLSDGKGFVNFIDVCYNKKTASTIYTKHTINGKAIKNAMKSNTRPSSFKTAEIPTNIAAATSFTKASQKKRFTIILGSEELAEEYLNATYLARGHLAPDGDGLFISWQMATYYYINVVPQWQSINNANWKSIEINVRSKAAQLREDVIIYTGGHQVLKLNNKKMTLESDGLEIPKWSWKILKNPANDNGIAFVTLNNPFETTVPIPLCEDICDDYGWNEKNYKTFYKGYTICCSVADLMLAIPAIPEAARVTNILRQ